MGSILDYIRCPHCGYDDCLDDYYYSTGEEYINCPTCGYHYSVVIKDKSKLLSELTKDDWNITEIIPWGAYKLEFINCVAAQCGTLETEQGFIALKESIKSSDQISRATLSRVVDGQIVKETFYSV